MKDRIKKSITISYISSKILILLGKSLLLFALWPFIHDVFNNLPNQISFLSSIALVFASELMFTSKINLVTEDIQKLFKTKENQ